MFNAKAIAAQIDSNVQRLNAKEIDHYEFSILNRMAWADADMGELPIIGSPCAKRIDAVRKELQSI